MQAVPLALAQHVLRTVLQHPDAYLFACVAARCASPQFFRRRGADAPSRAAGSEPVDPIALGVPDYLDVIKKPMDLGTILSRLGRGFYADTSEVLRGARARRLGSCARARRALTRQPRAQTCSRCGATA